MKFTHSAILTGMLACVALWGLMPTRSWAGEDEAQYRILVDEEKFPRAPAKCEEETPSAPLPGIKEGAVPRLARGGTDLAVILVHGFIASPAEVIYLAQKLHQAGATVYLPLIPNFGGDDRLANQASLEEWKQTLPQAIEFMKRCYPAVHLMGFSLGGALVSEFILRPEVRGGIAPNGVKILSATLLAPYIEPKPSMVRFLTHFMDLFTDTIALRTSYNMTCNPDLRIPMANPEYYNHALPLKAVLKILDFGEELEELAPAARPKVPVFLGINQGDETVDNDAAIKFVAKHFGEVPIDTIPTTAKLPHQFMALGGKPRAEEMIDKIIEFIKGH